MQLHFSYFPDPRVIISISLQGFGNYLQDGANAVLICTTSGGLKEWIKNNDVILPNQRYSVFSNATTSILNIIGFNSDAVGHYRCRRKTFGEFIISTPILLQSASKICVEIFIRFY